MDQENDNDIIYEEIPNNSKYSFYLGISSIGMFFLILGLTYLKLTNKVNGSLHSILNIVLALALFTIGITGIQYSIKSITQKEPYNFYKTLGIIANLVVLVIFISFIYTLVKDMYSAFQL